MVAVEAGAMDDQKTGLSREGRLSHPSCNGALFVVRGQVCTPELLTLCRDSRDLMPVPRSLLPVVTPKPVTRSFARHKIQTNFRIPQKPSLLFSPPSAHGADPTNSSSTETFADTRVSATEIRYLTGNYGCRDTLDRSRSQGCNRNVHMTGSSTRTPR